MGRKGQWGTAILGLLALSSCGAATAGEIMVCVYDGVPGPADPVECENADKLKADFTLAGLYREGWRIAELEVTSKFGGAATVMFIEKD